jgi:hypothetical protein
MVVIGSVRGPLSRFSLLLIRPDVRHIRPDAIVIFVR